MRNAHIPEDTPYTICKHCDHFVTENAVQQPDVAEYLHLEDGEQEFDHDAEPSVVTMPLREWRTRRPDLFHEYGDGKIGPNSAHHEPRRIPFTTEEDNA